MALFSAGSSLTYHLAPVVLSVTTSLPFILPLAVFPKALFLPLYSSSCTLPLSVLLSLPFPSTTTSTFMQMILSSSSLSTHSTLSQTFLIFKTIFTSLPWWLLIFLLITPLRLNSCSLDLKTNLPKYTTLHLTPLTLLETSTSSLTSILLSLTKLQLSQKPAAITFVNFAVSGLTLICPLSVPMLPLSSTPNLITVIPSTINSQLIKVSIIPSPVDPELSCSYCC